MSACTDRHYRIKLRCTTSSCLYTFSADEQDSAGLPNYVENEVQAAITYIKNFNSLREINITVFISWKDVLPGLGPEPSISCFPSKHVDFHTAD